MSSSEEVEELRFKILVLGEFGVGKSTLIDKFVELGAGGEFVVSTGGDSKIVSLKVDEKNVKVMIVCNR